MLNINTVINLVIIIQQLLTGNRTLHLKAEAACRLPITICLPTWRFKYCLIFTFNSTTLGNGQQRYIFLTDRD